MTARRGFGALFGALVLGWLIAVSLGDQGQASVELWLAAIVGWLALRLVSEVIKLAPLRPERLQGAWTRQRPTDERPARPRSLVAIEGLLLSATDSERAMAVRLRPRLVGLADHMLRTRHGIDIATRPDQASALLGDLAWLVDPDAAPQKAGLGDIERLLDILLVDDPSTVSSPTPIEAGAPSGQ